LLALAEGRTDQAIELLRRAAKQHPCPSCVLPDLGRAYQAAGRWREAAEAWQRYLTTPWLWRYEPDAVELGPTLMRLGEVSERLGDSAGARRAYQQLLELWKDADPALRPGLALARARLNRP
jgi:Flp pilus assembly protein TadD